MEIQSERADDFFKWKALMFLEQASVKLRCLYCWVEWVCGASNPFNKSVKSAFAISNNDGSGERALFKCSTVFPHLENGCWSYERRTELFSGSSLSFG